MSAAGFNDTPLPDIVGTKSGGILVTAGPGRR